MFVALLAAALTLPPCTDGTALGWTKAGEAAFSCELATFGDVNGRTLSITVASVYVLFAPGAPVRLVRGEYSKGDWGGDEMEDFQKRAWDAAEPDTTPDGEYATDLWNELQALGKAAGKAVVLPATLQGPRPLKLLVEKAKGGCGPRRLLADDGRGPVAVFELECPKGGGKGGDSVSARWNKAGDALELVWSSDFDKPGSLARLGLLTERTFAGIDLLDAGARDLEALRSKLAAAGQRVIHEAKAVKPRPASAVYFAKGAEAQAKAVAAALGLPESAVQPLSWKTPYAITVAAGSGAP